jgi:carbamoyltransferase
MEKAFKRVTKARPIYLQMIHWGITALNHGSSLAAFKNEKLESLHFFKNDQLDTTVVSQLLNYGEPDCIFWYERPWIKKFRQLYAGQYSTAFDMSVIPSKYLKSIGLGYVPIKYTPHHASHAAAGYYTSPFNHCAVVVLDAIGEFECATIWEGRDNNLKKVWSRSYPNSLGLFYSAFTKLIGLEPIKEEFVLQQMSERGDYTRYYEEVSSYINYTIKMTRNLHKGVGDWPYPITSEQDRCDIAAAVQRVFENQVSAVMLKARQLVNSDCLVYMGGCAMNSKSTEYEIKAWKHTWTLPNPGDPSSSMGAVLYHTRHSINYFVGK